MAEAAADESVPGRSDTGSDTRAPQPEPISVQGVDRDPRRNLGVETNRAFSFTGAQIGEPLSTFASTIVARNSLQLLETSAPRYFFFIVLRQRQIAFVKKQ